MLMRWMKILDFFFFLKRFLFDKQQCTGHQKVDTVLLFFFFAINQNWDMKTARGPRVNELDEFDEDEFNDDNDGFDIRRKLILGSYQSSLMVYESLNLCINTSLFRLLIKIMV